MITDEGVREKGTADQRYRLLIDAITDYAIYMLDPEGVITSWNPGAERFKGYSEDEIVGKNFSTFYTDEDRAIGLPQTALRIAAEEGRFEREGWRVRKDGSRFWAHVVVDPIRDDEGQIIGFAKITRDLTERMEAQRKLEEAREALLQSQKLEAIGQLTGGVAHDFNNLLMAILGSLELVRKRLAYDPRITPLIENAMQGAERGSRLTQRMLAFARKQQLSLGPVDLPDLVRGMLGFVQRAIGPAIRIELDIAPGLPPVHSDSAQLENALLNLMVNARDAMPDGGVITVSAHLLEGGQEVCLAVSDTGAGMDAETLARATEPFFTTKGVGKGTGLGLSMVHGLAVQSGGRMLLKSRPGEGVRVELLLPVAGEGIDHEVPLAAERPARPTPSLTILAVDDDGLVLINTAALLEDLGHEVLEAASAKEAIDIAKARADVDLVITDQAMPVMTGLQLRERLQSLCPGLPVIIATGYAEMPPDAGRDIVRLPKPFTQEELAAAVAQAMETASLEALGH